MQMPPGQLIVNWHRQYVETEAEAEDTMVFTDAERGCQLKADESEAARGAV